MGVGYIKSSEYESWAHNNRVRISLSELTILRAVDREYVAWQSEKSDPKNKGQAPASALGVELSARAKAKKEGGVKT